MASFFETITAAVADIVKHGFDKKSRIEEWVAQIKRAARASMVSPKVLEKQLNGTMIAIYTRLVEKGGIKKRHPKVSDFTIEKLKPKMKAELNRRMWANANLIVLNREAAIEKTAQRLSSWGMSVPPGGTKAADKPEVKESISKALKQLPFEERRVLIDQGHKLTAAISNIVAKDGGAIAVKWHSHWRQNGYKFRPDHKERDGKVYLIRGNWAQQKGLVKVGKDGYYDEVTAFAEEPFCRCFGQYYHSPGELPDDMLTEFYHTELERIRNL